MADIFFPGCKVKASYKEASRKAAAYLHQKLGINPIGCCRVNYKKLTDQDRAIVICPNCANIIEENTPVRKLDFIWQVVDQDPDFPFPDYGGESMTVQDCWLAVERKDVQDTVRSLMRKMNISIVEQAEHHERTRYCLDLLSKCSESDARLAPKHYVERGAHMYTPMDDGQKLAWLRDHCSKITTDKVVCYCKFCRDGIEMGGKLGLHLLEMLFPVAR